MNHVHAGLGRSTKNVMGFKMISIVQLKAATKKTYSHSSGPGGQHANKSSTKVQLEFDIASSSLSSEEQQILLKKYPSGEIHVYNQETRSQHQNEALAFDHLQYLIEDGLIIPTDRKKVLPPHRTKKGKFKKMLKDKLMKYKQRFL